MENEKKCYVCGESKVIWDADFDAEEYCMEQDGIIHEYHCQNCGASISVFEPFDVCEEKDICRNCKHCMNDWTNATNTDLYCGNWESDNFGNNIDNVAKCEDFEEDD